MYTPSAFAVTEPEVLHKFMQQHSFATLISQTPAMPLASHLPLLVDGTSGPLGRLRGHMARANSQWESANGQIVLAVFHGPHAYISPGWLTDSNLVPTWNYVTVHASGTLKLIDEHDQIMNLLHTTVDFYESSQIQPWSAARSDESFLNRLATSIVGFEIEIEQLQGKWKLSQNHSAERREQIVNGLTLTGRHSELQIANLMNPASSD